MAGIIVYNTLVWGAKWMIIVYLLLNSACHADDMQISLTGKPTNQTGTYGGMTSDRAVDGLYPGNGGSTGYTGNCAHPDNINSQPAEWWIDLEQMYTITSITLHNTDDSGGYARMTNFALRVYSGPGVYLTCAEYPGTVPRGSVKLTCADNVYGKYVQFIRLGGLQVHLVTLCEVEITGRLYPVVPNYNNEQVSTPSITSDTIEIRLEQITVPPGLSQYYGYRVTYGGKSRDVAHVDNSQYLTFSLTDLTYNTEYTVSIQPYRVMDGQRDYGTSYPQQTYTTKCAAPGKPEILTVTVEQVNVQDVSNINIKYEVPLDHGCDALTGITVHYRRDGESDWLTMDASLTQDTVDIRPTQSGEYIIKLVATNNMGLQAQSVEHSIQAVDKPTTTTTVSAGRGSTSGQQTSGSAMIAALAVTSTIIVGLLIVIAVIVFYYKRKLQKLHALDKYSAHSVTAPGGRLSRDTSTMTKLPLQPLPGHNKHTLDNLEYDDPHSEPALDNSQYDEIGSAPGPQAGEPRDYNHQTYEHMGPGVYSNSQITGPYDVIRTE